MKIYSRVFARRINPIVTQPLMPSVKGRGLLHTTPESQLKSNTSSHPYSPGSRLDLYFSPEKGGSHPLSVEVIKPFEPFTSAVALLVRPRSFSGAKALGLPSTFIVKINDIRYSIRDDHGLGPWSSSVQASLRTFVEHTKQGTLDQCSPDLKRAWNKETSLYEFQKQCYDQEVAAYRHLRTLQGRDIPYFYGTCRFPLRSFFGSSAAAHGNELAASILDSAEGMVLEYIDGLNLAEAHSDVNIPRADVERASEATLQIMKRIRNLGVSHCDGRAENVLMRRQAPHDPVLIDFGCSAIKPPSQSLAQWIKEDDGIKEMRIALSDAGVHVESPKREWANEVWGYSFFNEIVERRSKEWRERFYDPVKIDGPGFVVRMVDGEESRWHYQRWKLKPGVKAVDDHRYD